MPSFIEDFFFIPFQQKNEMKKGNALIELKYSPFCSSTDLFDARDVKFRALFFNFLKKGRGDLLSLPSLVTRLDTKHFLSQILCGFRKAHSTQHAIFRLLQSWQRELDESGYLGTILMDLTKAYDCIAHELLITKLEAYGLHKNSLNLIANYLSGRKQRTRIGPVFSE